MTFRNLVLAGLTPAQLSSFQPHLVECELAADKTLFEPGDLVQTVYFPSTAVTSVVTVMADGRCIEAATLGNESAVGAMLALSGEPSHARVFIQVAGDAWRLPVSVFREQAFRDPSLMRLILRHVQKDISQSEQSVACIALHNVLQRLAKWLLLTQDRVGGPVVPLTQEYLAIMLGVQRTTVTAAAVSLKQAKLIRYLRGRIEVIDREGLKGVACECYATSALGEPGRRVAAAHPEDIDRAAPIAV